MQKALKHKPYSGRSKPFARRAAMAARAVLAVTLLLTLVAGSIALPAAASGPMCAMACCAGRAPHAAGSCMEGSCQSGAATPKPAGSSPQSHHHHQQQPTQASDPGAPPAFADAAASVGGSDMGDVPTVEAAPYETGADQSGQTDTSKPQNRTPAVAATVLSKPCQADCGACASGVPAPKRSRNAAALPRSNQPRPPSAVKLARGRHSLTATLSAFGRHRVPRGPPLFFSC
jgi:hypothetical protein